MISLVRTQVQLTEDQIERLDEWARRVDCSRAELIRRLLDRQLEHSVVLTEEESWDKARQAIGQYSSGKSDTSEQHDEAFVESSSP